MARTADSINPLCQANAGEFHSGLQGEISRETEPLAAQKPPDSGSMNCDLLRWAADQTKISPHLQGILVRLVRLMDDDGVLAMKQADIAPLIRLGERQTRAAIAALVEAKVINRKRRGGLGGGRVCDALICNRLEMATGERPPLSEQPAEIATCDTGGCSPLATGGKAQPAIGGTPPLSGAKSATGDNAVELPVSEILDAEFVDNSPAPYKGTGARAQNLELITTGLELNPERADQPNTPARAKKSLVQDVCDRIGSPWLDPSKSQMLTTRPAKLVRWAAQLDLETELIPIMKAKLACNGYEQIASWNYFEFVVNDFIKDKKADQEARLDQPSRTPVQSASYPRAKRSRHIDALFGDEPDRSPIDLGRLDSCAVK